MRIVVGLLAVAIALPTANAQNSAAKPKFEVASVKRSGECFGGRNAIEPRSVTITGVPLRLIMMEAFKVKVEQIEGPPWLDTECIDISAKIPEGVASDQVPAMLQGLLAERFKLAAHKDNRARSGYALVIDAGGPKLKEDDPNKAFMRTPDGRQLMGIGRAANGALKGVMTTDMLAKALSSEGLGPVENATGLTGKYDIDLTWTRDAAFAPKDPGAPAAAPVAEAALPERPNLATALRETLGLKLERRNVQVQYVVVDHVERDPTEN